MATQLLKPQKRRPSSRTGPHRNGRHTGDIVIGNQVRIPGAARDLPAFRRWTCSPNYPERGEVFFLDGEIWVDFGMETFAHNQIKTIITAVLGSIIVNNHLGRLCADRMRLVHIAAGLSCEPDGMYLSKETLAEERVVLAEKEQSLEIVGTPDMVLEVISKTTVEKDTVTLRELYARADVPEYWLVDSRDPEPKLQIYRLAAGRYVHARRQELWVRSSVFGKSFQLTTDMQAEGPPYSLLIQ